MNMMISYQELVRTFLSFNRGNGAHINNGFALQRGFGTTIFTEQNFFNLWCIWHHNKNDVRCFRYLARSFNTDGTQ